MESKDPTKLNLYFLFSLLFILLLAILISQLLLLGMYYKSANNKEVQIKKTEQNKPTDKGTQIALKKSMEPELIELTKALTSAINTFPDSNGYRVELSKIRIDSVTGIGDITVRTKLINHFPQTIQNISCRIQLIGSDDSLVYQAPATFPGTTVNEIPSESWTELEFIIDNPPPKFKNARIVFDKIDFEVKGY